MGNMIYELGTGFSFAEPSERDAYLAQERIEAVMHGEKEPGTYDCGDWEIEITEHEGGYAAIMFRLGKYGSYYFPYQNVEVFES